MIYSVGSDADILTRSLAEGFLSTQNRQALKDESKLSLLRTAQGMVNVLLPNPSSKKTAPTWSKFEDNNSTTDDSVTLAGHTDDTHGTVGGASPCAIAKGLAKKYGSNKQLLTEVILVACESGSPIKREGMFYGSNFSEPFAQELADEMLKVGFTNENLTILSATPPEGAVAMRVSVVTQSNTNQQRLGQVSAFAYMDKDNSQGLAKSANQVIKELWQTQKGETYQEAFRNNAGSFKPKNQSRQDPTVYLTEILNKRGLLKKLLDAIYQKPLFSKTLLAGISAIKQKQQKAREEIVLLKSSIEVSVNNKIAKNWSGRDKWQRLKEYLDCMSESSIPNQNKWTRLSLHRHEFQIDTKTLGLNSTPPTYKQMFDKVEQHQKKIEELAGHVNEKKKSIISFMEKYVEKHNKNGPPDKKHKPKIEVMKALKSYIENPTATTWNSITEATQKNPGWDAGCFSQVSNVHDQITRLKNTDNDFEGNHSGPNTH